MFCSSCGAELTGAFCTRCGAPASQPPSPSAPPPPPAHYAQQPQYVQPPHSAAKSGGGWKILIAVLATLGLLGVLAIAGVWYAVHKVKQEVTRVAASQGVDLSAISQSHRGPVRTFDACALLTKEDLSQLLSLPVERAEGSGKSSNSECRYYSSQAQQRGQAEALAAKKKIEESKSGNAADQAQNVRDIGNLIRGVTGAAGAMNNAPTLTISIDSANPKAMVAGFKTGMGLTGLAMKSQVGSGGAPNLVTEDVQGVGDEGVFAPLFGMSVFRKGDVAVSIDGRMLPGGREAQIAIAKRIFSKL